MIMVESKAVDFDVEPASGFMDDSFDDRAVVVERPVTLRFIGFQGDVEASFRAQRSFGFSLTFGFVSTMGSSFTVRE